MNDDDITTDDNNITVITGRTKWKQTNEGNDDGQGNELWHSIGVHAMYWLATTKTHTQLASYLNNARLSFSKQLSP